jgi:hypothetical protein
MVFDPHSSLAEIVLLNFNDSSISLRSDVKKEVSILRHDVKKRGNDRRGVHICAIWGRSVVSVREGIHSKVGLLKSVVSKAKF